MNDIRVGDILKLQSCNKRTIEGCGCMGKNCVRKFVLKDVDKENDFLTNIENGEDFKPMKIFISYAIRKRQYASSRWMGTK